MFRKFLETWHTFSSPKVIFLIFGVRRENFLMGLKIDFKFEILGILVQNPDLEEAIFGPEKKFLPTN